MNKKVRKPRTYTDTISEASDPHWTLLEWRKFINQLVREYGPNATLGTEAGYNNVSLIVTYKYRIEDKKRVIDKAQ